MQRRSTFWLVVAVLGPVFMACSGIEPVRLASVPALSPDGTRLTFHWCGDLWSVPTAGGTATPITHHPGRDSWACMSPDGSRLAFISDRDGTSRVYVMPVSGGTPEPITIHTEGATPLQWFPDGTALLIAADRDGGPTQSRRLLKVQVDSPHREELLFDAAADWGQVSPDGGRILFVRDGVDLYRKGYQGSRASQIWLYTLASGTFTRLCPDPGGSRRPLWRPDGQAFYYLSARGGVFNLWQHPLSDGAETQLTHFTGFPVTIPCLSADGSTFVFRHRFDFFRFVPSSGQPPEPILIQAEADGLKRDGRRRWYTSLWNNDAWGSLDWSGDGLEMTFTAGGDVWVMDTVLKEPVQVTANSGAQETEAVWADHGESIVYVSDQGHMTQLRRATRQDRERFWWQNRIFDHTVLLEGAETLTHLSVSPDGKRLAFVRGLQTLCLANLDGGGVVPVATGWRCHEYAWSPDSRWLAVAMTDSNENTDIWIVSAVSQQDPCNVSRHPDWDGSPAWSPDGSTLAFVGNRGLPKEQDVFYVYLSAAKDDAGDWERTLDEAVSTMKAARGEAKADAAPDAAGEGGGAKPGLEVTIDTAGLWERVRRLSLPNSRESDPFWGPNSKDLAFVSDIGSRKGTYTVSLPHELTPQFRTGDTGTRAVWTKDTVTWICGGKPGKAVNWKNTGYDFTAFQDTDLHDYQRLGFRLIWRIMRDRFHDPQLNALDWSQMRLTYEEVAASAPDADVFARAVSMLLGELNASHMGFTNDFAEWKRWAANPGWGVRTDHLGVLLEPAAEGVGMVVKHTIADGPADKDGSRLNPGDTLLEIDGVTINGGVDMVARMTGRFPRTVALRVRAADGQERRVDVRPVSYPDIRQLRREEWIDRNRAVVEEKTGGRLGYVHIDRMNWPDFSRFQQEVFSLGYGREGLIIDVRFNSGGLISDHLLTILCRPRHAVTVPRGGEPSYPDGYLVYNSWDKPIILLCNEYTESNAEILCHAVQQLRRGKIVGTPTPGSVISTGSAKILDLGTLRVPERSWFRGDNGVDMEMGGVVPDIAVPCAPGELPAGVDHQLETAIETLSMELTQQDAGPTLQRRLRRPGAL